MFINRESKMYDVVFMDAFNSASSIPFQLTTVEVAKKLYAMLDDHGAVMINVISSVEGDRGMFLRAEYATYAEVFPQVYIFPIKGKESSHVIQNVMILALKSKEKPTFESGDFAMEKSLEQLWQKPIERDMPILTDDFAPVEYYRRKAL